MIAVGKIKEKYFNAAIEEYVKGWGAIADRRLWKWLMKRRRMGQGIAGTSDQEERRERILQKLPENAFVVALDIDGKALDSEELAAQMERWNVNGISHLVFLIGGSLGLAPEVLARADYRLSFSRMTFPHQLMRVILLEQIYRSFRIRIMSRIINNFL